MHPNSTRTGPKPLPLAERFWAKVTKTEACWLWNGFLNQNGYGYFRINSPRCQIRAPRMAYELSVGPIPPGLFVCHHCDNPSCVRPDHLFIGSQLDNMRDMAKKGHQVFQQHPDRAPMGSRNHSAKLTDEEVSEIRLGHCNGESSAALADRYKVGRSQINRIARLKAWTHIKEPPLTEPC